MDITAYQQQTCPTGALLPFPGVLDLLHTCRPCVQHMLTRFIISQKRRVFMPLLYLQPVAADIWQTPARRVSRSRLLLSEWFIWPLSASHTPTHSWNQGREPKAIGCGDSTCCIMRGRLWTTQDFGGWEYMTDNSWLAQSWSAKSWEMCLVYFFPPVSLGGKRCPLKLGVDCRNYGECILARYRLLWY